MLRFLGNFVFGEDSLLCYMIMFLGEQLNIEGQLIYRSSVTVNYGTRSLTWQKPWFKFILLIPLVFVLPVKMHLSARSSLILFVSCRGKLRLSFSLWTQLFCWLIKFYDIMQLSTFGPRMEESDFWAETLCKPDCMETFSLNELICKNKPV